MPSKYLAYSVRNNLLRELGFKSYRHYLSSDLWASIRVRVRARSGGICECCAAMSASQVHHASYDREYLLGEKIDKLIDLCEVCHRKIERKPNGVKRGFEKTNGVLNRRRIKRQPNLKIVIGPTAGPFTGSQYIPSSDTSCPFDV